MSKGQIPAKWSQYRSHCKQVHQVIKFPLFTNWCTSELS